MLEGRTEAPTLSSPFSLRRSRRVPPLYGKGSRRVPPPVEEQEDVDWSVYTLLLSPLDLARSLGISFWETPTTIVRD